MKYVYKFVAAIGALTVIPLIIFGKMIYFKISSVALQAIISLGQIIGLETFQDVVNEHSGKVPQNIADNFSIYDLLSLANSGGASSLEIDDASAINFLVSPALTFVIIAVIVAICAVVTAVLAFACKDNRKVIYSSIVGIGFSAMLPSAFNAIAAPILDGRANIAALVDAWWAGLVANITELNLNITVWFIPAVFGAVILWTVLYNITLPEKEKKERLLMIGEAEEK